MKKVTMEPLDRLANLQALWDSQTVTEVGPCGMQQTQQLTTTEQINCQQRFKIQERPTVMHSCKSGGAMKNLGNDMY